METGTGVRAISLAGAYTGVADDHASVYWNPSGLTKMKKIQFEISGFSSFNRNKSVYIDQENISNQKKNGLSSLSLVYPLPVFRGSFVFAFAFQSTKHFDRSANYAAYDTTTNFFPVEYQYSDGTSIVPFYLKNVFRSESLNESGYIDHYSLACAIDLSPVLSVGISLGLIRGRYTYSNQFKQDDINNIYNSVVDGQDIQSVSGCREFDYTQRGMEIKLGFTYQVNRSLSLGTRIDLPVFYEVVESYSESNDIYFDDPEFNPPILDFIRYEGENTYNYYYPLNYSLGLGYEIGSLLLSGQFDYRDWMTLDIKTNDIHAINDKELTNEFHFRIGGEYFVNTFGISIRSGFHWSQLPYKINSETIDIYNYAFGLGYIVNESIALNFAVNDVVYTENSPGDDILPESANNEILRTGFIMEMLYRF